MWYYLNNIDEWLGAGRPPLAGLGQLLPAERSGQAADRLLQQIHLRHRAGDHRVRQVLNPAEAPVPSGGVVQRRGALGVQVRQQALQIHHQPQELR